MYSIQKLKDSRAFEKSTKNSEDLQAKLHIAKQEIIQLKSSKVELMRQHKNEKKRLNDIIRQGEVQIRKLIRQNDSLTIDMQRKLTFATRKEEVLRQKVDEAKHMNQKLKTLIDQNKKLKQLNDPKKITFESIQKFLVDEISLLFSVVDTKVTMKSLISEKNKLEEHLREYQMEGCPDESTQSKMSTLIDDIRVCETQIDENQSRLNSVDVKETLRLLSEGMTTVKSSNFALSYVMKTLLELQEELAVLKISYHDLEVASEYNRRQLEASHFDKEYEMKNFNLNRTMQGVEYEVYKKIQSYMQSPEAKFYKDDTENANVWITRMFFEELKQNLYLKGKVMDFEKKFGKQLMDEKIAIEEGMERKNLAGFNATYTIIEEEWSQPKQKNSSDDNDDSSDSSSYKSMENLNETKFVKNKNVDEKKPHKSLIIDGVCYDYLRKLSEEAMRKRGETPDYAEDPEDEDYDLHFSSTPLKSNLTHSLNRIGFKIYESEQRVVDKFSGRNGTKHVTELSAEEKQNNPTYSSAANFFYKLLPDMRKKISFSNESFNE